MDKSRSRSRSPIRQTDGPSDKHSNSSLKSDLGPKPPQSNLILSVRNLPSTWNYGDVKKFVLENTKSEFIQKFMGFVKMTHNKPGQCWIIFSNLKAFLAAKNELKGKEVEGRKIFVSSELNMTEKKYIKKYLNSAQPNNVKLQMPSLETFGLSKNFLHSLNIDPPLDSKIIVSNLDDSVTESNLRDVFGRAGKVIHCELIMNTATARIEFDHPVEAVQAISMFHNQTLHNKMMRVIMDNKQIPFLPDGLESFGPGLGPNGTPLKFVRREVELEPLKKMVVDLIDMVKNINEPMNSNQTMQIIPNNMENNPMQAGSVVPAIAPFGSTVNMVNPNNLLGGLGNALNPLLILQGLLQQNAGNDGQAIANALQTLQNSNQNVTAFNQTAFNQNAVGQNVSPFNQTAIGQNVSPFNQTALGQNVSPFNQTAIDQNVSPFNQTATGQNVSPFNQTATGQNVSPFNQTAMGQNVSPFNQAAIGQNLPGFSQTALGQNISGFSQTAVNNQSEWNSQSQQQQNVLVASSMQSEPVRPPVETNYNNVGREQSHPDIQQRSYNEREDRRNDDYKERRHTKYQDADDVQKPMKSSDMLVFNNLPPSVSLDSLTSKMREVGKLKFAEMTGQGRAIVRFMSVRTAERCVQLFHHSKVDGQVIEVRYF